MKLKDKLQMLMSRKNLNGQKLAKLSSVSDSEISRILQGKSRPGLDNAYRLAKAVGVSLDYLADDNVDYEPPSPASAVGSDEQKLLSLIQKIGSSEAITILENARFLGYDIAMSRLVGAKPIVEVDTESPNDSRIAPSPLASSTATTVSVAGGSRPATASA